MVQFHPVSGKSEILKLKEERENTDNNVPQSVSTSPQNRH